MPYYFALVRLPLPLHGRFTTRMRESQPQPVVKVPFREGIGSDLFSSEHIGLQYATFWFVGFQLLEAHGRCPKLDAAEGKDERPAWHRERSN